MQSAWHHTHGTDSIATHLWKKRKSGHPHSGWFLTKTKAEATRADYITPRISLIYIF